MNKFRNLIVAVLIFLTGIIQAQVSNINTVRVANATTTFGRNLPVGSQIFDLETNKLYILQSPAQDTQSISTSSVVLVTLNETVSANSIAISTNTANISTNTSAISTNTSNIASNTSGVNANASAISSNASGISTNTSNISANSSAISTNTTNISSNTSGVNANATAIGNNSTAISTNSSAISSNSSAISINTGNISSLQTSFNNLSTPKVERFSATAGQTQFTLQGNLSDTSLVFLNGSLVDNSQYSGIGTTTLTFSNALVLYDNVVVYNRY